MATSVPTRRGPPYTAASAPTDEDFINRSLLDSVNAQGDAEPGLSSSDSEAPGVPISPFGALPNTSTVGPSSVPYHRSIQPHQPSHPDSPSTTNIMPSYLQSPPLNADSYSQGQNSQQLYNSVASLSSPEHDALNSQTKASGFSSAGAFRNPAPFTAFSNGRSRHNTAPFGDTSSTFAAPAFGPAQTDIYISNPSVPQNQQSSAGTPFEPMHHPGRYDYALNPSQSAPSLATNGQSKPTANFSAMDAYRLGLEPTMPIGQQMKQGGALGGPPGLMRDPQGSQISLQQSSAQQGFQAQQLNGLSHPLTHQGQTYGVHAPVNAPGSGSVNSAQGASAPGPQQSSQQQPQEEISTIFVVGFPDDMSVRTLNSFSTSSPQD